MSGITGLLRRDGTAIDESALQTMTEKLAHRGPDGSGVRTDGHVGLGHQYMATTPDRQSESLPREISGFTVTGDIRLDNRAELINALDVADATAPDSELIVRAYDAWGTACTERLLGAFAFAVRDADDDSMFCARDHMGVKPFYYALSSNQFAFASEPPALVELDCVSRSINETRVGEYLGGHPTDRDRTFYADLARLPPGHTMTVTDSEVDTRQYWSAADVEPLAPASTKAYERRFRELFLDAVGVRMPNGQEVGSFLSGGLDSGSIASAGGHLRAQRGDAPFHTFSALFDDFPECDEREYIESVVEKGEVQPHYIRGDRVNPLSGLDRHLRHRGQPFHPSLFMLIWRLYEEVASEDLSVVMHGYGGDQTMGSGVRGHLRDLFRRGRLPTFARELRGYLDRFPEWTAKEALWEDIVRPMTPTPMRKLRHSRFDDGWYIDRTFAPIDPEFAREIGHPEWIRKEIMKRPPMSQRGDILQSLLSGELPFHLEMNNIAAAAWGVEPRFPYMDKRLVEFSLGLPPGESVRNGLDRVIVRNALTGILPPKIAHRDSKAQFSANVRHGTRAYAFDTIEETLFEGPATVDRYLKVDRLRDIFDAFQSEPTAIDARNLLMATTLERWLSDRV